MRGSHTFRTISKAQHKIAKAFTLRRNVRRDFRARNAHKVATHRGRRKPADRAAEGNGQGQRVAKSRNPAALRILAPAQTGGPSSQHRLGIALARSARLEPKALTASCNHSSKRKFGKRGALPSVRRVASDLAACGARKPAVRPSAAGSLLGLLTAPRLPRERTNIQFS